MEFITHSPAETEAVGAALGRVYSKEIPKSAENSISENGRHIPGSVSFVPSSAGLIIAGEVICDLCKIERIN